jgi:hypothetical protein
MPQSCSLPKSQATLKREKSPRRPIACIVIGGLGSQDTQLIDILNQERTYGYINRNGLKEYLSKKNVTKYGLPQQISERLGQDIIDAAAAHQKNMLINAVGLKKNVVQSHINALMKRGYDVELHWIDTNEQIAINQVDKYNQKTNQSTEIKKSNRHAKAMYTELAKKNYGQLKTHRWSVQNYKLQLDDATPTSICFKQFIESAQERREALLKQLDTRDLNKKVIEQHLKCIQTLLNQPEGARSSHDMLMAIVSDIATFPELYIDYDKELDPFYQLLENNDCHVYYTSIQRNGPMKSHGCVAIGSPHNAQGVVMAAAGEPRRGKIKLPTDFKLRLIKQLQADTLHPLIVKNYGTSEAIVSLLNSKKPLDSHRLRQLLTDCKFENLLTEFVNKIQFNMKYSQGFELWNKPRSSQQLIDTHRFNQHFPVFLADQSQSALIRKISSLHHTFTRRTAIQEQAHVNCGTVLKRWLALSSHQKSIDALRTLAYNDKISFLKFDISALSASGGNCNTISTYILGALPKTASIANWGTTTGISVILPSIHNLRTNYQAAINEIRFKRQINDIMQRFLVYLQRVQSSLNNEDLEEIIAKLKEHLHAFLNDKINFQTFRTSCEQTLIQHKTNLEQVTIGRRTVYEYISDLFQALFNLFDKLINKIKKSGVNHTHGLFSHQLNIKDNINVFEKKLDALVKEIDHDKRPSMKT